MKFGTHEEKYSYHLMGIYLWYIPLNNSVLYKFVINNWNFFTFFKLKMSETCVKLRGKR